MPKCDFVVPGLSIIFNRDWLRNIWHRVANDIYQAFLALRYFGLQDRRKLTVVHIDFANKTFGELYGFLSSPSNASGSSIMDVHALPSHVEHICFEDALFMVSRHWSDTWPDGGRSGKQFIKTSDARTIEFGHWLVDRIGLGHVVTPYLATRGKDISVTWVTRKLFPGNRAMANEDAVIERAKEKFGPHVLIDKVDFDNHTIEDQIRIARTTDILLGAHGAGLTHILWLPSHAVVLEVLPMGFNYPFYERVALLRGLRHYYWQPSEPERNIDCTWMPHTKFCNIILDERAMIDLLSKGLESIRSIAYSEL